MLKARTSKYDPLGRYYTNNSASEVLVEQLSVLEPVRILDLGSGEGALTAVASKFWNKAEIVTVDIEDRVPILPENIQGGGLHHHFRHDALDPNLPGIIEGIGTVDIGICNPPFTKPEWKVGFGNLLEEAGLSGCVASQGDITSDLLFLAQNLRVIKTLGHIGIIVPDALITGKKYKNLRKKLIDSHCIKSVIKLPRNVFARTDAQAYILTLVKNKTGNGEIELKQMFRSGHLSDSIHVNAQDAIERLDFSFNEFRQRLEVGNRVLASIDPKIYRGKISSRERLSMAVPAFHITDFPNKNPDSFIIPKNFYLTNSSPSMTSSLHTIPGDILLARVGRNFDEKVCRVKQGHALITDCIFLIRVEEKLSEFVYQALISDSGRQWLRSAARGVGALHISKSDLLNFPLERYES